MEYKGKNWISEVVNSMAVYLKCYYVLEDTKNAIFCQLKSVFLAQRVQQKQFVTNRTSLFESGLHHAQTIVGSSTVEKQLLLRKKPTMRKIPMQSCHFGTTSRPQQAPPFSMGQRTASPCLRKPLETVIERIFFRDRCLQLPFFAGKKVHFEKHIRKLTTSRCFRCDCRGLRVCSFLIWGLFALSHLYNIMCFCQVRHLIWDRASTFLSF